MEGEILNKVAQSSLVSIDLEKFYPEGRRHQFDIKDWLYEGVILREKDFRDSVNKHDWSQYQDGHVAVFCSEDAIVPLWAFMLVSSCLQPFAKTIVQGDAELLESVLYRKFMDTHDFNQYTGKPMIIKGCSNKPVPTDAFVEFVNRSQAYAKSIMFGEPCSTVPVFKQKK